MDKRFLLWYGGWVCGAGCGILAQGYDASPFPMFAVGSWILVITGLLLTWQGDRMTRGGL